MTRPYENSITVSEDADVIIAGRRAKGFLEEFEFGEQTIDEIVLVAHELASNIVKHAGDGSIELSIEPGQHQDAIEIRAVDSGPGIEDVDKAIIDGYSTVGSLGGGLGTVHRLMDDVIIHSNNTAESGVEVVATRSSADRTSGKQTPPIKVNAATRPQPRYEQNGDAFLIEHGPHWTLVGVIDGLGHGPAAHRAANTARQYLQTHSTQSLTDLFAGVEEACRSTRGVVMLLARFDWEDKEIKLGTVGNITVKVCESRRPYHLVPQRGVVGGRAPSPKIDHWDLDPTLVMVIHTDGISSEWNCDDFNWHDRTGEIPTADRLLREYSKADDDATVLIIRGIGR